MTAPTAGPVDYETASLLDLIAEDRIHADDRATVTAAIERVAADNDGLVSMNRVRPLLHNEHGPTVHPNVIGATVNALRRQGRLVPVGWEVTEGSATGNTGKPQRVYRHSP